LNTPSFSVYNASAGSGKTYTLVKEVLKILLKTPNAQNYQHLLAITFTNKAVAEMKERVLSRLHSFSRPNAYEQPCEMMQSLSDECDLPLEKIHHRSKRVLQSILHNFSALEISTIDGFTHRVIRTFAKDLGLTATFEVVLDAEMLLNEVVDAFILDIDEDPVLKKHMIAFALEKIADDKSWNISRDFFETSKLMLDENHYEHLYAIKNKSQSDFSNLQEIINTSYQNWEEAILQEVQKAFKTISELGLETADFAYKDFPNFLQKCADKKWDGLLIKRLSDQIESGIFYSKKTAVDKKVILDTHFLVLSESYHLLLALCSQALTVQTFKKSLPTFSLINALRSKLDTIQKEQNTILISAFNKLISETINEQPTPFIYERLGVKFQHYFIDEFQDTSQLQWQNLVPLIGHSLEGASHSNLGSLLLVGDAKQSIYRWRGGRAEQFMELSKKVSPFTTEIKTEELSKNYRSFTEIIQFNNAFFQFVSTLFQDPNHQHLYADSCQQEANAQTGGYVSLDFIEAENAEEEAERYSQKVLETIRGCSKEGFSYADQCVLTRTKKQGITISEFLVKNGIPVISSETLLLKNSKEVQFLLALLRLQVFPEENQSRSTVLNYYWNHHNSVEDYYLWFKQRMDLPIQQFFNTLDSNGKLFDFDLFVSSSLYDSLELAIQQFKISNSSNAHIHYFMDTVFEFSQRKSTSVSSFLAYWEKHQDKLTIASGEESQNAVRIMTIHKSKGLEFEVVIFPYAQTKINDSKNQKCWFPVDPEQHGGFSSILIPMNQKVENMGEIGERIYKTHQSQQQLDAFNLLYVTLTRAKEQLYIISHKKEESKSSKSLNFASIFKLFLEQQGRWKEGDLEYCWGDPKRISKKEPPQSPPTPITWIGNEVSLKNILVKKTHYWEASRTAALDFGLLFHEIIAQVRFSFEIPQIIGSYRLRGSFKESDLDQIEKTIYSLVNHPKLLKLFSEENEVLNEKSLITKEGEWLIPDRIITDQQGYTTILDYKTGVPQPSHKQQIDAYGKALSEMGFVVKNKWIVYLANDTKIIVSE